ncbi:putative DNA-binding domain-containing protein [Gilvimarinus sp. 2_MG-2023]|uniref:HvfC family RiPP maturation protein n=1 Tax=Gilvimarinus sp. 2_MG-2023 TaxID=3062666 RepID=UPI0026E27393|nr:putative DNA-binding domain-containing protein [Gilvimarinus sp. 2_MG-2023]MDO6570698.1 putative DNA-binding domain-containing protein [Gilvimarinus sp. 2_MG-2023]
MSDFQQVQQTLSDHLRDPGQHLAPAGMEDRRVAIYRDLIYNNIEGFIAGGFPVLRDILNDELWHALVRDFVRHHRSLSPYFLEISQEFLQFLQREFEPSGRYPDFMLELAHYEWVELALDVAPGELPAKPVHAQLLEQVLEVSPLLWCLSYRYPVHQIGPDYQPETPPEAPTFLLVYRDRSDKVAFMLSNAVTVRLIKLLQSGERTGREALLQLVDEMQYPTPSQLLKFGSDLLEQLYQCDILWPRAI